MTTDTEDRTGSSLDREREFERALRTYDKILHESVGIPVHLRVILTTLLIMAGIGDAPLAPDVLTGEDDMGKVIDHVGGILRDHPIRNLYAVAAGTEAIRELSRLGRASEGERSKVAASYEAVRELVIPAIEGDEPIDFAGKMFNALTSWIDVPDGAKNDVVLTPRYVADLMCDVCEVDMDSRVWDNAAGTGGLLIASIARMANDAKNRCADQEALDCKIESIYSRQTLGVELREDVHLLRLINMVVLGYDSSCAVLGDSFSNDAMHESNKRIDALRPNVLLLNPPYSAPGNGLVFAEKAMSSMSGGRAAVLIQESAGSGAGVECARRILSNNTLLASVKMADIFYGKAGVRTALYVFEVGVPHDVAKPVKFIDMSDDGYERQNRRKGSPESNLRDRGDAKARYAEVASLVLEGSQALNIYTDDEYVEDIITLQGDDWSFSQHRRKEESPLVSEDDLKRTVSEHLIWKMSVLLRREA